MLCGVSRTPVGLPAFPGEHVMVQNISLAPPVIAERGKPMHCLPSLRRVAGQKLIRDDLVHRDVQPGAERLAADDHLVITAEAWDGVPDWVSGPLRSRAPLMTAPPAKIPAIHQNAVS